MGELWRAAAEKRRGGKFVQLSPSADAEWLAIVRGGADAPEPGDAEPGRPRTLRLLEAWAAHSCAASSDEECVEERWGALLCDE